MILSNENVTKDFYSSADVIKYFVNDKIVEQKWKCLPYSKQRRPIEMHSAIKSHHIERPKAKEVNVGILIYRLTY